MPATDSFFRNLPKTHTVFALNSILLLLATLWMLHDDHNDEWRAWQQKWDRIEDARLPESGSTSRTPWTPNPSGWTPGSSSETLS